MSHGKGQHSCSLRFPTLIHSGYAQKEVDKSSIEATTANTTVTELVIYRIDVIKTVLDALRERKEIRTSRPATGEMYGCLKTYWIKLLGTTFHAYG